MAARDQNQSGSTGNLSRDGQSRWWHQWTASFTSPADPQQQQQQQQQQATGSDVVVPSPSPVPIATSTPRTPGTPPRPILVPYTRSEKHAEDELFQRIERLIRDFLNRPNRRSHYHRIMEWTLAEEPTLSYSAVVIVNQPSTVLD